MTAITTSSSSPKPTRAEHSAVAHELWTGRHASFAARVGVLAYGLLCYAIFFATFLYAMGFITGFLTPTSLDASPRNSSLPIALLINITLLGLFAVQHSVMARPTFKRWWTRFVPKPMERSTYTLLSSVALAIMFWQWRPIGGVIWDVQHPTARIALIALGASGWLLVLASTFLINHFDLFGLRQSVLYFLKRDYTPLKFKLPVLYRFVRHPLYLGWLIAFWACPTMTVAHLLFAAITTMYIFVAIQFEERNLVEEHGRAYHDYRRRVPMILPIPRKRRTS